MKYPLDKQEAMQIYIQLYGRKPNEKFEKLLDSFLDYVNGAFIAGYTEGYEAGKQQNTTN